MRPYICVYILVPLALPLCPYTCVYILVYCPLRILKIDTGCWCHWTDTSAPTPRKYARGWTTFRLLMGCIPMTIWRAVLSRCGLSCRMSRYANAVRPLLQYTLGSFAIHTGLFCHTHRALLPSRCGPSCRMSRYANAIRPLLPYIGLFCHTHRALLPSHCGLSCRMSRYANAIRPLLPYT